MHQTCVRRAAPAGIPRPARVLALPTAAPRMLGIRMAATPTPDGACGRWEHKGAVCMAVNLSGYGTRVVGGRGGGEYFRTTAGRLPYIRSMPNVRWMRNGGQAKAMCRHAPYTRAKGNGGGFSGAVRQCKSPRSVAPGACLRGAPGRIRTSDLQVRSLLLYPAGLLARKVRCFAGPVPRHGSGCRGAWFRCMHVRVARQEGFEPPTYRFVACCSIQLGYWRVSPEHFRNGWRDALPNPDFSLVRRERFELPTYRFVACCSIQLSYRRSERRHICPMGAERQALSRKPGKPFGPGWENRRPRRMRDARQPPARLGRFRLASRRVGGQPR